MIRPLACLLALVLGCLTSAAVPALSVDIGGKVLRLDNRAGGCLKLGGQYAGFRIEPSEPGKTAKICSSTGRRNAIKFEDVTFIATDPSVGERVLRFEHDFSSGPKGLVYAKAVLDGFFAQATGAGVPSGSQVSLESSFDQTGSKVPIGPVLEHTVDAGLESALFELVTQAEYVLSGRRKLAGVLRFSFQSTGDKLVLESATAIVLDGLKRQQERTIAQ